MCVYIYIYIYIYTCEHHDEREDKLRACAYVRMHAWQRGLLTITFVHLQDTLVFAES